ncbi:MAG: PEP-CTERM sorting domain-containing protein [Terracidiphilus sp.]
MKKLGFALLALAAALATAPAAMATGGVPIYVDIWGTSTANPNGTSGVGIVSGGGVLTGTLVGGSYEITGGTFTIDGMAADLIPYAGGVYPAPVPSPGGGGFTYDDTLSLTSPYVDAAGALLFSIPSMPNTQAALFFCSNVSGNCLAGGGGNDLLEFYNTSTELYTPLYVGDPPITGYDINMSASLTPEPSSWLLMGTGLLFLVGFLYRKAKPGFNQAA